MEPDATVRLNKHRHEPDEEREEDLDFDAESPEFESLAEPEGDIPEPQPSGVGARFRKFMQRSTTSEQKGSDKRKQLKEDRTKTFMMLAGGVVVMALVFFALFSSPSSSRKMNNARSNQPNLGRGPGGESAADTGHSVTPLLNADTRKADKNSGAVTPEDIRNTAKLRAQAQAGQTSTPPVPKAGPKDYALNKIDFPAEPGYVPPAQAPSTASALAPPATASVRGTKASTTVLTGGFAVFTYRSRISQSTGGCELSST